MMSSSMPCVILPTLAWASRVDDLLHVVAHLLDGLGKGHGAAVLAQQQRRLVHLDDDLRLLAA